MKIMLIMHKLCIVFFYAGNCQLDYWNKKVSYHKQIARQCSSRSNGMSSRSGSQIFSPPETHP